MKKTNLRVNCLYGDKDGVQMFRKAPKCYDGALSAFYQVFYNDKASAYRAGYEDKRGNIIWRKNLVRLTENEIKYLIKW